MDSFIIRLCITLPLTITYASSFSQIYTHRVEAGVSLGAMIYQGDLTPERLGAYATLRPQVSIYGAYLLNRSFSVRGNLSFGGLKADDAKYATPEYRQHRNFRFTTPVTEFSGMLVWDILRKNAVEGRRGFAPYLFAGAGITLLNIQRDWSQFDDTYFNSEDLAVRLQQDIAHRTPRAIPVIPLGAGIKYFISGKLAIKAETNYRLMFSDYLDGFSKAANPQKTDSYHGHTIGVVFSLGYKDRNDCPPVR